MLKNSTLFLLMVLILQACGGGGGSDPAADGVAALDTQDTASDVAAVDTPPETVYSFPEGEWVQVEAPVTGEIRDIWALAPDNVWFVGADGILHWDGNGVTKVNDLAIPQDLYAVQALAPDDVWAAGGSGGERLILRNQGAGWELWPWEGYNFSKTGSPILSFWHDPFDDFYIGGDSFIARYDHTALFGDPNMYHLQQDANHVRKVRGIAGPHAFRVWFGDEHTLIEYYGEKAYAWLWDPDDPLSGVNQSPISINDMWALAADEVWAGGGPTEKAELARYDGTIWEVFENEEMSRINSIWSATPGTIWFAGDHNLLGHFDGQTWHRSAFAPVLQGTLLAIHGDTANSIWIAGTAGRIWHCQGTTCGL